MAVIMLSPLIANTISADGFKVEFPKASNPVIRICFIYYPLFFSLS